MSSAAFSRLVEQALSRIAAAAVETPDKAARLHQELTRWRAISPTHEAAYAEALRQWRMLGTVAPALRGRFADTTASHARVSRMRHWFGMCVIMVLGGCVTVLLSWYLRQATFAQSYATGTAQLASVQLPDGSRIDLNARSALHVTLYRHRRVVEFTSGEARFEVVPRPHQPFCVYTRAGVVEVVGTVFVLTDRGGPVTIAVEQGRVRFTGQAEEAGVELASGERLTMRQGLPGPIERHAVSQLANWREGWLVFDHEPLAEALPAINAFRHMPLRLADGKAGSLRLTGRFRATDAAAFLAALPKILPVIVQERADGSIDIRQR